MARQSHSYCQRYAYTAYWHDKAVATVNDTPTQLLGTTKPWLPTKTFRRCSPRNDSLLRTTLALHHLAHVTTRCYGLATRSIHPRLTQRTVKTGRSIYRPRRPSNAASSPRNDSLLRTTLTMQHLVPVTTRCYGLH